MRQRAVQPLLFIVSIHGDLLSIAALQGSAGSGALVQHCHGGVGNNQKNSS